jgi:hypothetical protein
VTRISHNRNNRETRPSDWGGIVRVRLDSVPRVSSGRDRSGMKGGNKMGLMNHWCAVAAGLVLCAGSVQAKDLGDILVEKGLITKEELQQAKEEEKQKVAAEESRRDAVASKIPKWLDAISFFGDVRTREEGFYAEDLQGRNRFRIRARVGLNANVTDEVSATVRLATGDSNDPISTNQTLGNTFTRKPVNLDWAYITLKPGKTFGLEPGWGSVVGGKFGVSAYRTSELIWDDDLSPEGFTETLNLYERREGLLRGFKVNAFEWIMDENAANYDPWMAGGQMVADAAFGTTANLTMSFADFNYMNINKVASKFLEPTSSSYNGQLANSNDVVRDPKTGKITRYKYGFNIINFASELNFPDPIGMGIPAGLFEDVAYNTQAEGRNVGLYLGAGIGKAGKDWYHNGLKNPGDWGMSYTFSWVEKDALLSLVSYSDLDYVQSRATQKGSTNVLAHILRFDYELFPNFQLTAKGHFINALDLKNSNAINRSDLNKSLQGNQTLFRTQLDAVLKF